MSAISIEALHKAYGDVTAVDDLSLAVDDGETFGLLGPNGTGKTTILEILTGQLTPDGGRVSVLGVDPVERPTAVRERVGVLPEKESPPSFMPPREYFPFVGAVRGLSDEPLANLDPVVRERVKRFLCEYRDAGNTVVLTTHDVDVTAE